MAAKLNIAAKSNKAAKGLFQDGHEMQDGHQIQNGPKIGFVYTPPTIHNNFLVTVAKVANMAPKHLK